MMRYLWFISGLLIALSTFAQEKVKPDFYTLKLTEYKGDSIPMVELNEVMVLAPPRFENPAERSRYYRLKYNVKKVYPYAVAAACTLERIDSVLQTKRVPWAKKRYLKSVEKELEEVYKEPLKNLTITQGKILVKLVHRETDESCYYLIKDLKHGLSARFWQTAGWFLGYDLKAEYDPEEEKDIESIVRRLAPKYK